MLPDLGSEKHSLQRFDAVLSPSPKYLKRHLSFWDRYTGGSLIAFRMQ
jgi:hypothetical protein